MKSRIIRGGCQASAPFSPEFAIKVLTEICKEITIGDTTYSLISATPTFFFVTFAIDKLNPPMILKYGVKTNTDRIFTFLDLRENTETKSLVTFFLIFLENCMAGGSAVERSYAPTKPQPEDTPCVPGTEVTVDDIIFFVASVLKNEIITYQESNFSLKEPLIIFSLGIWRYVLQKKDISTQHIDIKYAPIGSIKNNILTFIEHYILPFFIEERKQMIEKIQKQLVEPNLNPIIVKPIIDGLKLHTRLTGNTIDDIKNNLVRLPREDLQKLLLMLTKTI
jgi:hypothetical protein